MSKKSNSQNKNKKEEKIVPLDSQMTVDEMLNNSNDEDSEMTEDKSDASEEDTNGISEDELTYDEEGNINKSIKNIIHEAMMPYSEYVILDRALPRIEDGFKPVQRRILYSMYQLGLFPDKPFKKSAKVVGDCMANYHPHGDSSVYNAMVRMTQNFNMSVPLVKGHGNFGSMDGDSPAAMRYTEAKLHDVALELLRDIEKNTVTWALNYDDSKEEPEVLPSRFPNLLVNGSSGIAVGLATNIPPHNLNETIDAVIAYIEKKRITLDEIMEHIKGPDFPLGGIIIGDEGIKKAYKTGKGKIVIRSKVNIEKLKSGKKNIVIDEFPYQVNKANLLKKIANLKEKQKEILSGISNIQDESDRNGVRAVIELRKGADEKLILNYLYKHTDLQISFFINMVAIADGKPRQLGLLDIIKYYTEFQRKVVYRKNSFELLKAKDKKHILDGLITAILDIDKTIKIIKEAASVAMAKLELQEEFDLSEKQSQAILDMKLSKLNSLEIEKLRSDIKDLEQQILKLTDIVESRQRQMTIVKKDLLRIKKEFGIDRRTKIIKEEGDLLDIDSIKFAPVRDVIIAFNKRNAIKMIPTNSFNRTSRVITDDTKLNEVHDIILETKTDRKIMIFTDKGYAHKISLSDVSESKWKDRGDLLSQLIPNFSSDERVVAAFPLSENLPKKKLIFFTDKGLVKLTDISEYDVNTTSFEAIKIKDNDRLINVDLYNSFKTIMFITKYGIALNAKIDEITPQGRVTVGVRGIKLSEGDSVIYAGLVKEIDNIILVTNKGYNKNIAVSEFPVSERYRKGIKAINLSMDNGLALVYADKSNHKHEIIVINEKNKNISINTDDVLVQTRTSKGRLINGRKSAVKVKSIHKYEWEAIKFAYDRD